MLYDVHTHIGLDQGFLLRGWWPYASTAQDLLQHLEANGIDRAVCFPFGLPSAFDSLAFADRGQVELPPGRAPFDRENALLVREVRQIDQDRRLLVLAMFDPSRRVAEQIDHLKPLVGHIAGLKVQATILATPVRDLLGPGRDLMAFARQHDLPVLIHASIAPDDHWSPARDCLEVAAANPRVRFNLAHSLRFHEPSLRQAAEMPNVWVDCSAHLVHCELVRSDSTAIAPRVQRVDADYTRPAEVLRTIHQMLNGRYLWGSDNPFMSWCDDGIRAVYSYRQEASVLHALPPAVKASMGAEAPPAWLFGNRTAS